MEAERLAKRVHQFLRSLRLIEVLHDDGEILHRQGDRCGLQQKQNYRQHERQRHREAIAHQLRQLFLGLCEDSPHTVSLILRPDLAALAGLLDHADKYVFE